METLINQDKYKERYKVIDGKVYSICHCKFLGIYASKWNGEYVTLWDGKNSIRCYLRQFNPSKTNQEIQSINN